MKIEDGKIKPCSTCYRARQAAKDAAALLSGKQKTNYVKVETEKATFWYTTATRTINTIIPKGDDNFNVFLGRRVYLAGRSVIDVALAEPMTQLGKVIRSTAVDEIVTDA